MHRARASAALVVAGALIATGCSPSSTPEPAGPTTQPTSLSAQWLPSSWKPTVAITMPTLTEGERVERRAEWLTRNWSDESAAEPPEVDLVRWTSTWDEHYAAMAECLQAAGFPAVESSGPGIEYEHGVPESQDAALNLAWHTCASQYSIDPAFLQDWTPEQVGLVYDYWGEYFIPCMAAHEHPIDTSGEPSREAYVAAFHTSERIDWWPSMEFDVLPRAEREALVDVCPPYPPSDVMYGR